MIFVDANVFLRYLTSATTSADLPRKAQARNLFNKLETGDVLATTSEVVLHEVCYILGSPKHYHHIAAQIAPELSAMIQWPGFVFPMTDKDVYVRAFELWEEHPRLEFSDSVIAARCERAGHELATFDQHFQDLPFLQIWQPEASASEGT
jgi:predicted nucleic acid-binding protein